MFWTSCDMWWHVRLGLGFCLPDQDSGILLHNGPGGPRLRLQVHMQNWLFIHRDMYTIPVPGYTHTHAHTHTRTHTYAHIHPPTHPTTHPHKHTHTRTRLAVSRADWPKVLFLCSTLMVASDSGKPAVFARVILTDPSKIVIMVSPTSPACVYACVDGCVCVE